MKGRTSAYFGKQTLSTCRRRLPVMRRLLWFISTIAVPLGHPLTYAQAVTKKAPQEQPTNPSVRQVATQVPGTASGLPLDASQTTVPARPQVPSEASQGDLPDLSNIPLAIPLPAPSNDHIVWDCDTESKHGEVYLLAGDVQITFRNRHIRADSIQLNEDTGEVIAEGHLRVSGGDNDEYIQASHGTYNLRTGTGRFFDAQGSVGLHNEAASSSTAAARAGLVSPNPFLFTGRIVDKTGAAIYTIYDGTVTSCLLPKPDWMFSSRRLAIDNGKVHAGKSVFHLLGLPILFLPYLTTPTSADERQSGLLIPVFGDSSTKGVTVGEQAYFALGRSADLTLGTIYYSLRGFSESGTFRYRGSGYDFATTHFSALEDRGYTASNGVYVNQGGEDLTAAFRHQLSPNVRAVGDGEYLSSYIYREAFTDNFNQAVSSDITSIGFITRQTDGWSIDGRADRYQGLKQVPIGNAPGEEVHILHVPSFDLYGVDRPISGTPFLWTLDASAAGLKRVQPNFTSSGVIERFDFRPELSLPLHFDGWNVLGSVAVRETAYTRSREMPYSAGAAPVESTQGLNRADLEMKIEVRPPTLERTFAVPETLQQFFGTEVRHTIEPEVTYRDVRGVNNFLNVLRFDEADLVSDTNQLEYGLTQHLYFRPKLKKTAHVPAGCPSAPTASAANTTGTLTSDTQNPIGDASSAADAAQGNLAQAEEAIPDVLTPSPGDSTDANGIPVASSDAPETPLRTHARHLAHCIPPSESSQQALVTWRLTQRYFFDPTFGNAVIERRRNIFESTLSLSGIAFLTEPRNISPLVSRLRVRTSGHTDLEWDFDLDTGAKKFTSSNVFLDAHDGPIFGGVSYARLNAPGRFATEVIDTNSTASLVTSPVSNFSQLRFLIGYGVPSKPGLSVASNIGLDLLGGAVQYAALQTSYNWNCCGFAVEYRKFDLGTVRDENSYRFNFTLANIGSAGNIRRTERLF
ncbi:MAG: LPS-assembly protein LptD [Janthinobacterium lividum]